MGKCPWMRINQKEKKRNGLGTEGSSQFIQKNPERSLQPLLVPALTRTPAPHSLYRLAPCPLPLLDRGTSEADGLPWKSEHLSIRVPQEPRRPPALTHSPRPHGTWLLWSLHWVTALWACLWEWVWMCGMMTMSKQVDSPCLGSIVALSLLGHKGLLSCYLGSQVYESWLSHKRKKKRKISDSMMEKSMSR